MNFCLDPIPDDEPYLCHIPGGGGGGGGAGTAGNIYQPADQPGMDANWQSIFNNLFGQYQGGQSPGQMAWPQVQQAAQGAISNPFQGQAYGAPQTAFDTLGPSILPNAQSGVASLQGLAGLIPGAVGSPNYAQANAMGQQIGPQLATAGTSILNQGFDPQGALFNRTQSQVTDQSNAANAMYGLGSSPFGASTTANALGNFDINWQNNQLNRERTAIGAAAPAFAEAESALLTPANAQLAALGSGIGDTQAAYGGAGSLLSSGMGSYAQGGSAPYSAFNTVQGNDMSALQNLVTLGNSQYILPEQLINNANSYLRLGQSANDSAANLAAQSQRDMMSGLGGLGSLAGSAFGGNGLFSSGGIFGSGAGALGGGGLDFGGGGAAMGIADQLGTGAAAAGGADASAILPMMMMGSA